MSTTLPVVNRQPELVGQLLEEQQQLSAVDEFSRWHEQHDGGASAAPAQEKYYRHLLPASAPEPGQQLAFEVDLDACSGCKACVVACHTLNGLEEDESWRRVGTLLIGDPEYAAAAKIQHVTTACHHCEDPGCLSGCPVKAYEKDPLTGIVSHLDDQCIGCKYCTMMCPYEVPQYSNRLGIVRKCDMCHQRLSVGEAPACVQSCPNEAIKIVVVGCEDALAGQAADSMVGPGGALVPSAPSSAMTRPTTRYAGATSLDSSTTWPQDANVDELAESHWPLAIMLVATQISVGLLIAELLAVGILTASGVTVPGSVSLSISLAAFVIGNIGLGLAPLHLGQPLRSWRVFLGLKTSWLSREAVVLGQYMGLLVMGIALQALTLFWNDIPDPVQAWIPRDWIPLWAARVVLVTAIPVGLAGLFSSAMIYVATRRQLWRLERTLPRFLATAAICGPMGAAIVFASAGFPLTAAVLCLVAAATGALKWGGERKLYAESFSDDIYDQRSKRLIHRRLGGTLKMRSCCAVSGVVFAMLAALLCVVLPPAGAAVAGIAALVMIVGENLERLLYFQSVVHDRMPGTL